MVAILRQDRFTPGKSPPGIQWTPGSVGLRAGLEVVKNKKALPCFTFT
jgi:hypothetical protein